MCPPMLAFVLALAGVSLVGCSSDDDDGTVPSPEAGEPSDPPGEDDPQSTPEPLVTFDTQEALLEEVFAIYSGEAWDRTPLMLPSFTGSLFGIPEGPSESEEGWTALIDPALCRSGDGELVRELPSGSGNVRWRARLDACAPEDPDATGLALIDGNVEGEWNWHTAARSDDLAWTRTSGERVSFTGEMRTIPLESKQDTLASFVATDASQLVRDGGRQGGTPGKARRLR